MVKFSTAEDLMGLGDKMKAMMIKKCYALAEEIKPVLEDAIRTGAGYEKKERGNRERHELTKNRGKNFFLGESSVYLRGNTITVKVKASSTNRKAGWGTYAPNPDNVFTGEIIGYTRPKSGEPRALGVKEKCSTNKMVFVITEMINISEKIIGGDDIGKEDDKIEDSDDKGTDDSEGDQGSEPIDFESDEFQAWTETEDFVTYVLEKLDQSGLAEKLINEIGTGIQEMFK